MNQKFTSRGLERGGETVRPRELTDVLEKSRNRTMSKEEGEKQFEKQTYNQVGRDKIFMQDCQQRACPSDLKIRCLR